MISLKVTRPGVFLGQKLNKTKVPLTLTLQSPSRQPIPVINNQRRNKNKTQ